MSEGKMSEGKMSEGKMSEGKMSEGKMSEGKMSEGKMSEGKMSEGKPEVASFAVNLNTRILTDVEKIFGKFRFRYRDVTFQNGLLVNASGELFFDLDPNLADAPMPDKGTPVLPGKHAEPDAAVDPAESF